MAEFILHFTESTRYQIRVEAETVAEAADAEDYVRDHWDSYACSHNPGGYTVTLTTVRRAPENEGGEDQAPF